MPRGEAWWRGGPGFWDFVHSKILERRTSLPRTPRTTRAARHVNDGQIPVEVAGRSVEWPLLLRLLPIVPISIIEKRYQTQAKLGVV